MIRRSLAIALLWMSVASCFAQMPTEADEKFQESLVTSAWSGEILGTRFESYLLDEGLLIFSADNRKPQNAYWRIVASKFYTRVRLSEQIVLNLVAEISSDRLLGTTDDLMGTKLSFELRKDQKPSPQLLAAAPPNRPHPPAPRADPREFDGTYEMNLPERIGQSAPLQKHALACGDGKCVYFIDGREEMIFDRLAPIRSSHFQQARGALKYALDRKARAKEEAPYLAPLLDSGGNLRACIDLGMSRAYQPGLMILCKADREPWKRPAVLLMGSIISDTCTAFCRYGIMPLLRQP